MLLKTGVNIEHLTDIDMHLMVEKGIRGGLCTVGAKRHVVANNKYMIDYDPAKPSSYITYLDANNLYGWGMMQCLPTGNFRWADNTDEMDEESMKNIPEDSETGYILEVDLEYPKELHDSHDDYPLCPENKVCVPSPEMGDIAVDVGLLKRDQDGTLKAPTNKKLVANLFDKTNHVIHYRELQVCLRNGMKLKKVHRAIAFDQSQWLRPYIEFNTDMRQKAKNGMEKDFFKLMNNSVYGKFLENVRNRREITFTTDLKVQQRLANSQWYLGYREFEGGLYGIERSRKKIVMNKPISIGVSILGLSKVCMFSFHYDVMKKHYGDKIKMLYTDTDSLVYEIKTEDFYDDIQQNKEFKNTFDFSEYSRKHPLFDKVNKAVPGKFKDEVKGRIITEFCSLKAKMYSFNIQEVEEKKKAKGISKTAMGNIRLQNYKDALYEKSKMKQSCEFYRIVSKNHHIETKKEVKRSLTIYDDKRYYFGDLVESRAQGHFLNGPQKIDV
jgi:hypothetical protein